MDLLTGVRTYLLVYLLTYWCTYLLVYLEAGRGEEVTRVDERRSRLEQQRRYRDHVCVAC